MGELTRWNLKVSRETDLELRTFLAERGGKKGDLSRFIENAVNRAILLETINEVRERNADIDTDEIQRIIDKELAEVRRLRRERSTE